MLHASNIYVLYVCMYVFVAAFVCTIFLPIKLQVFISFPVSQTWQCVSIHINQKTGLYKGAYLGGRLLFEEI